MQLIKQTLSQDKIAIGIKADSEEEVNLQYNSFYNWGATNGELIWMNNGYGNNYFAFIWTSTTQFTKWLINSSRAFFTNNPENEPAIKQFKHKRGGINDLAKQRAQKVNSSIIEEKFLPQNIPLSNFYSICEQ